MFTRGQAFHIVAAVEAHIGVEAVAERIDGDSEDSDGSSDEWEERNRTNAGDRDTRNEHHDGDGQDAKPNFLKPVQRGAPESEQL